MEVPTIVPVSAPVRYITEGPKETRGHQAALCKSRPLWRDSLV